MSRSGVVINPRNSEFGGLVYDMCGAKWRILGVDFVVLLCRLLHGFGWLSVVGWGVHIAGLGWSLLGQGHVQQGWCRCHFVVGGLLLERPWGELEEPHFASFG